jgi:hypothetical protein
LTDSTASTEVDAKFIRELDFSVRILLTVDEIGNVLPGALRTTRSREEAPAIWVYTRSSALNNKMRPTFAPKALAMLNATVSGSDLKFFGGYVTYWIGRRESPFFFLLPHRVVSDVGLVKSELLTLDLVRDRQERHEQYAIVGYRPMLRAIRGYPCRKVR